MVVMDCQTKYIAARQRWAINHGARTRIISYVLTRAGLNKSHQDFGADLHPDEIKNVMNKLKLSCTVSTRPSIHSLLQ